MKGPSRLPLCYEFLVRYKYYATLAIGVFYNIKTLNDRTYTRALKLQSE